MADDKGNDSVPPMATLNRMTAPSNRGSQPRFKPVTFLIAIVVVVLLIFVVKPKQLDVYKTFDELQFEDPALAQCVRETAAANDWLEVGDALKLRCNNPSGKGIESLVGIEHMVELAEINLSFNQISDLEPLVPLARLEILDLSHNRIARVPVFRSAPALRRIELNYNQIESLDWLTAEHFLALEGLSIGHNHVTDITNIPALDGISELSIRDNRIVDLEPLWQLQDLVMLDAGKNLIEDISGIGALGQLRRLFLDRNKIVSLDGIEALHDLEELDLAYNSLESTMAIASLERLQRLNLTQTGLTDLEGILSLGDLDLLRVPGNPELACADIAAAAKEYGEAVVRSDKPCSDIDDESSEN